MKAVTKKINGIEFAVNGEVKVSSIQVAENFDKQHGHVIEAIKKLLENDSISRSDYRPRVYKVRGREYPCYDLTEDGFAILVMGFSGDKAIEWKIKFMAAFKKMKAYIIEEKQRAVHDNMARLECPAMTLALKETRQDEGKDTKPHHYSNEHNLIYRVILGVTKKKWCDDHDIDKKDRFRDHLPTPMIEAVEELQRVNTSMIEMGFEYRERKTRLDKLYTKKYLNRCLQAIVDDNA